MYSVWLRRGPKDKHGLWESPRETRYYGPDEAEAIAAFNMARHVRMARLVQLVEHASDGDYRLREFSIVDGTARQVEIRSRIA